jgi:hypothetical protein
MSIWKLQDVNKFVMAQSWHDVGNRALFGGAYGLNGIHYVEVSTLGNQVSFGDLANANRNYGGGASNSQRGIFGGGSGNVNHMDYVTIDTTGDAADFGNLSVARNHIGSVSNRDRGIWAGGLTPSLSDTIDWVTMATTGDAADFGNLSAARSSCGGGMMSFTRGVFADGAEGTTGPGYGYVDTIEYITMASTGNATDFGNSSQGGKRGHGTSSTTRGVYTVGDQGDGGYINNIIEYITIATTGNSTDFGDLSVIRSMTTTGTNRTRGIFIGGYGSPVFNNGDEIDYINFASTGNAIDFGDCTAHREGTGNCSSIHGGIPEDIFRPGLEAFAY